LEKKNGDLPPLSLLAEYVPKCTLDGDFDDLQCDERFRVCWCTEEDGSEVKGSRVPGDYGNPPRCGEGKLINFVVFKFEYRFIILYYKGMQKV